MAVVVTVFYSVPTAHWLGPVWTICVLLHFCGDCGTSPSKSSGLDHCEQRDYQDVTQARHRFEREAAGSYRGLARIPVIVEVLALAVVKVDRPFEALVRPELRLAAHAGPAFGSSTPDPNEKD